MSDLLDVFLSADINVEDEVYIKRIDSHIKVKALLDDEISAIKEEATHVTGKGKNRKSTFNAEEFGGLLVAKACVNIDFSHPKLLEKHGASDAGECARKALYAGEINRVRDAVFALSGYGDDEDLLDEAKN